MSPACTMAGYPKTFCTASLPLGLDAQEGLCSAIKMCLSETSRPVALRQQALKHWQRTAAVGDTLPSQLSRQQSGRERSSGKRRELAGAREQRQRQPPRTTTSSYAATAKGSAVRGTASTATASAAPLPQTDIYRCKLHCLPTQTDANKTPDPRRRSTLQCVVFVLNEKNYIEYLTRTETQQVYL